jgi:hypothetical protein
MLRISARRSSHNREVVMEMPSSADMFLNLPFDWGSFLKGSSILTIAGLLLYSIIRWKVIELVSVETSTVAIRTTWGKPRYYNRRTYKLFLWGAWNSEWVMRGTAWAMRFSRVEKFVSRLGRLVVLHPGVHKVFRGWHGLIEINLREIPLDMGKMEMTYRGRTLAYDPVVIVQLDYSDDHAGDRNLINSVYSVRDTQLRDQSMDNMRAKIKAMHARAFADVQGRVSKDKQGFPKFDLGHIQDAIAEELLTLHGYRTKKVLIPPMAWTDAQVRKDGQIAAAHIDAKAKIDAAQILAKAITQGKSELEDEEEGTQDRSVVELTVAADALLTETA